MRFSSKSLTLVIKPYITDSPLHWFLTSVKYAEGAFFPIDLLISS